MHSCEFAMYRIGRGATLPPNLDLSGCLAVKLDLRKRSLIHRIIMRANRKHIPDLDTSQVHAFVVLGQNSALSRRYLKPIHRVLEFGLPGAYISNANLAQLASGDEAIIFEPKSAALRARICAYSISAASKNRLGKIEVLRRLAQGCLHGPQIAAELPAQDLLAFRPRTPDVPWFSHCGGLTATVLLAALKALNHSIPELELWDPRRLYPAQLSAILEHYVTQSDAYFAL